MKKFLKNIFSVRSDKISYLKELLQFSVVLFILISLSLMVYFLLDSYFQKLLAILVAFLFMYLFVAFISRLIEVNDNKKSIKLLKNNRKIKWAPIYVDVSIFVEWLKQYDKPETIYFQSIDGKNHIIEIVFDVKGQRGDYYNKKYYFDNELYVYDELAVFIDNNSFANGVKILASFDENSPQIVKKEIDEFIMKNLK